MISVQQYFGKKINDPEVTPDIIERARALLDRVNELCLAAVYAGAFQFHNDPDTGHQISGSKGGSGDGGYRLMSSKTGAQKSKHKEARAVDVYDPDNHLDNWLTDGVLADYGLYREHPDHTPGWCHLQSVPPRSGARTFLP